MGLFTPAVWLPQAQIRLLQASLGQARALHDFRFAGPEWKDIPYPWTRIFPLLACQSGLELSAAERDLVQEHATTTARENALLRLVAESLLIQLERAGVEVLLLKGLAVADSYYPRFELRPMGDFDLLIQPHQMERAEMVLQAAGWVAELETPQALHVRHATGFVHPTGVHLDLHWYALGSCCWSDVDQAFWRHSQSAPPSRLCARRLCPAHNLLHICAHGVTGGWSGLWVADCCLLLQQDEPDWDEVVAEAGRRQIRPLLVTALGLLRDQFQAHIPAAVMTRLQSQSISLPERIYNWCRGAPRQPLTAILIPVLEFYRSRQRGLGLVAFLRQRWGLRPGDSIVKAFLDRVRLNLSRWRSPKVRSEPPPMETEKPVDPQKRQTMIDWIRSVVPTDGLEQVQQFWTPQSMEHAQGLIHPAHNDPNWTRISCELVLTPTVLNLLEPLGQRRTLEIGCGVGRILKPLSSIFEHCYGVDISPGMLALSGEFLQGVERVSTLLCDGKSIPLPDESVDLVYSVICFQHIPNREVIQRYLQESFRTLRPGGLVRAQTVDVQLQPVNLTSTYGGSGYAYAALESFADDFRAAGFEVVEGERSSSGYLTVTGLKAKGS